MRLTKQQKDNITAIGIGAVLAVVVLWYSVMGMQKDHLVILEKKRDSLAEKVVGAKKLVDGVKKRQIEFQDLLDDVAEKESFMASGDLYSWVWTELSNFTRNNGHEVRIPLISRDWNIGPSRMIPGFPEPYQVVTYKVQGVAYYHDFGSFLADFENTHPYLRVQSFRLFRSENQGETGGRSTDSTDENSVQTQNQQADSSEKLSFEMELVALTKIAKAEGAP